MNKSYQFTLALLLLAFTAFSFAADKSPLKLGDESNPSDAPDGTYSIDKTHGYITFSYSHQGYSKPMLRWRDWDSTLEWNGSDPSKSTVSVSIDASKVDSGVDVFDDHLRGEKFFDVENHPEITFTSTKVTMRDNSVGTMIGDLTIKGKTLPATVHLKFNKTAVNKRKGAQVIGLTGHSIIKRSDWGMDTAVPMVSDEVEIIIQAEYLMTLSK